MTKKKKKKVTPVAMMKKRAVERVAETLEVRDEVALKSLRPIAKEINVRFEKAALYDGKAVDHRLAAALLLADARKLCEKHKINFRGWSEDNVTQNWGEVRVLANVGGADDPRKAIEDLRENIAARGRKHRAVKKLRNAEAPAASEAPPPLKPEFEVAEDALEALGDESQLKLVESRAHKLGMVVLSETQVKKLRGKVAILDLTESSMKEAFAGLGASDKMAFLNWAAGSVGAAVVYDFSEEPPVEAPAGEGPLPIPDSLKRKADKEGDPAHG